MTGWGQEGPYAHAAGHDVNYIALAGVLDGIGPADGPPVAPLSYVGDYGGGTMFLLFGLLCALHEARSSGRGQVVDAAMVDGAAALSTQYHALLADGKWQTPGRGRNVIDGGAPYYGVYECSDGRYVSIASAEPPFYRRLRELLDLDGPLWDAQHDQARWPEQRVILEKTFRTRTRDEWCALLEGTDACFAPVLSMDEAPTHPHNVARGTFVEAFDVVQPAPAPRLSRTPGAIGTPPPMPGRDTREVLAAAGFSESEVERLLEVGAAG